MKSQAARVAFLLLAFVIFIKLGYSRGFYRITVPYYAPFLVQMAIRKLDSIIAFAAAGAIAQWLVPARRQPLLRCAILVGALSFGIEIAQTYFDPPQPFGEHLFDVMCGALGGIIGSAIVLAVQRSRARKAGTYES